MQAVIGTLLVALLGCGRSQDDARPGDAAVSVDSADTGVAVSDVGKREDGCPTAASGLALPCEPGKVCKYYDACTGWDRSIALYTCEQPPEKPLAWYPTYKGCSTELRPDGCPYGGPGPGGCDTPGKTCVYSNCTATQGSKLTYVCKGAAGSAEWIYESKTPCYPADGG